MRAGFETLVCVCTIIYLHTLLSYSSNNSDGSQGDVVLEESYIRHCVPVWESDEESMKIDAPELSIWSY